MSEDFAIKVKNVSKTFQIPHDRKLRLKDYFLSPFQHTKFKRFDALKNISFNIKRGEFVGIVGRNGSGKSTLLKILAEVYEPNEGSIERNGRVVPFLELGVGFNPELTGRENVFLNGTILGMTKKQIIAKYNEILKFADIEEFMDTQLKHYSSGMLVRLAFAVAIQAQGDIYLLDEILAVGDAGFQIKCKQAILNLKNKGKTIIFVSHDHASIRNYSDKVIFIKNSKIESIAENQKDISLLLLEYLKLFENTSENSVNKTDIQENVNKDLKNTVNLSVSIKNTSGNISKIFDSKDSMIIEVLYNIKDIEILKDIVFGISIENEYGIIAYGTNTELMNVSNLKQKGTIQFTLDNLNLIGGTYYITVGAHSKAGRRYYWDDKEYLFNIISSNVNVGVIDMGAVVKILN